MNWINAADNLPALRKRVLVTDGQLVSIAWINDYRKGWEGWVTLDTEYLDTITMWSELPIPPSTP